MKEKKDDDTTDSDSGGDLSRIESEANMLESHLASEKKLVRNSTILDINRIHNLTPEEMEKRIF